jgi:hypothetical protein
MHSHGRQHRHLRRSPDFLSDVGDALNALNPFANNAAVTTTSSKKTTAKTTSTPKADPAGATTITRVVYTTMTPTFDGPVGGLTTLAPPVSQPTPDDSLDTSDLPQPTTSPAAAPTTTLDVDGSRGGLSSSAPANTVVPISAGNTPAASSVAGTGSADSSGEPSTGAKAGIAIGVLAGVLVVFLLVWFAFQRRRKQAERQPLEDDDEKINGAFSAASAFPSAQPAAAKAPRISLRPVTQFLPNLNFDRRTSRGANAMLNPASAGAAPAGGAAAGRGFGGGSAWERPTSSSHSNNPNNPFGNQAERAFTPIVEETPSVMSQSRPVSPMSPVSADVRQPSLGIQQPAHDPFTANGPPPAGPAHDPSMAAVAGAAAGATLGVAAAGTMARKTSIRRDGPKPLDLTVTPPALSIVPPSPAGTEFSVNSVSPGQPAAPSASAAAIAAAGGPPISTVHRVQLDFKPTLEDELELVAGQLVRLLHEYDDGWALCIRLDRSRQGVCPRTCLSARPVKPRPPPGGGPRGPPVRPSGPGARGPGPNYPPNQRPMGPQGGQPAYARPESPMTGPGQRPQSPAGRPISPYRPASPAGGRSMSPGPGQQRPQSPMGARRMSPPGPSPMNPQGQPQPQQQSPTLQYQAPRPGPPTGPVGRKPVPGQAA